jgi:hypothetical protein
MDIADIFPPSDHVQRIYCEKCRNHLDLSFTEFDDEVSGVHITVKGLPVLKCSICNSTFLPDRSRLALIKLHHESIEKGSSCVRVTRKKTSCNFDLATIPFQYDSDDYYYIPGLFRDSDDGFLTPVFFNKEVLIKYDIHPSYRVNFASRTYGQIQQEDDFSISFGINKYGRLVMWLGDIAQLPENEQYYLRSENVPSDHSIGSEFYDGQIECQFTDPTPEDHLFEQRSRFLEACFHRFGQKIAHLEKEVLERAIAVHRPVVDTLAERRNIADSLNKIYIESIDNNTLETLLTARGQDAKNIGSLKRLQKLLETVPSKAEIAVIMKPLYVMNDLRVACSHLGSDKGQQEKLKSVCQRLDLISNADIFTIYDKLIPELSTTFRKLAEIVE